MLKRIIALFKDENVPAAVPSAASAPLPEPEAITKATEPLAEPVAETETTHEADPEEAFVADISDDLDEPEVATQTQNEAEEIEFCGLMLEKTNNLRRQFLENLREILKGNRPDEYSPEVVRDDKWCELGKWLLEDAKSLAKYPEYAVLVEKHRAFHDSAAEVISLHQQAEFAATMATLRQVEALSAEIEASLFRLHEQAQAGKAQNGEMCS